MYLVPGFYKAFRVVLLGAIFSMGWNLSLCQPGACDTIFGNNGIVVTKIGPGTDVALSTIVQEDQKIVSAGYSFDEGQRKFTLIRYDTLGIPDPNFGNNGLAFVSFGTGKSVGTSLILQPDQKLVLSGYANNGAFNDFALARFNTDGTLDQSFGNEGKIVTSFNSYSIIKSSALDALQRIIVAGTTGDGPVSPGNHVFAICRYLSTGKIDSTFGDGGKVLTHISNDAVATSVAIQTDGKIVVSGYSYIGYTTVFTVVRYNTDGSFDQSFGDAGIVLTSIGISSSPNSMVIQSDGRIVVVGNSFDGQKNNLAIVRYNSDGMLDSLFAENGVKLLNVSSNDNFARSVILQPDHKILVATNIKESDQEYHIGLVRLLCNGSIDSVFGEDGITKTKISQVSGDFAESICLQKDNKILLGGWTKLSDTVSAFAVIRYLSGITSAIYSNSIVSFRIYPNPVKHKTTIEFFLKNKEIVSSFLMDMNGRVLAEVIHAQYFDSGLNKITIDLPEKLSPGVYILSFITSQEKRFIKIEKEQ